MFGELYLASEAKSLVGDVMPLRRRWGLERAWLTADHGNLPGCGTGTQSQSSPRVSAVTSSQFTSAWGDTHVRGRADTVNVPSLPICVSA